VQEVGIGALPGNIAALEQQDVLVDAPFPVRIRCSPGPHIDALGDTPLMVRDPTPGWRQLISAVDSLHMVTG